MYVECEDLFRGSRDMIEEREAAYYRVSITTVQTVLLTL